MRTIEIRVDGFDFEDLTTHLMQLSKDEGVSMKVKRPSVGPSGLRLDTAKIIASGANVLTTVIASLLLYLGTVSKGEILIEGDGWRVEVPRNMPQQDIERNIELAQGKRQIHQTKKAEEWIVIQVVNLEGGL